MQSEWSYARLRQEAAELKKKLEEVIPIYTGVVKRLAQTGEEFDRRGCLPWVDCLMEKARADFQRWQTARQQGELLSKFAVALVDLALVATRQQPMPLSAVPPILITIHSNGEIRPALADEFSGRGDIIRLTWEQFERIAHRLKAGILQGEITLNEECQAARLIYGLASSLPPGELPKGASRQLPPG